MKMNRSVLILDDDTVFLKLLSLRLKKKFPNLIVDCQQQPLAVGAYDIYILDNNFHGRPLAADLAELIKRHQPECLVVALSGSLDTTTLKRLINCGCSGAFDKGAPAEIDALLSCVSQHLDLLNAPGTSPSKSMSGFADTARAIGGLIRDWNRRLELEELRANNDSSAPGILTRGTKTVVQESGNMRTLQRDDQNTACHS